MLVLPVIAPSTYQEWLSRQVEVSEAPDGLVQISYFDSGSIVEEYRYVVDTASGLVHKLEKHRFYDFGYQYRSFSGSFFYNETTDDLPVLRMIAFNDDTTLVKGGYRFSDVEVNTPLDDMLFSPHSGAGNVSWKTKTEPMTVLGARPTSFNLLGRALPSSGREYGASGLQVIVTGRKNQPVKRIRDRRDWGR